ncbi:ABC transporter permease [Niallia oryzisoli]|uniref:ABC transporter permease n=2 Tax=Niallia oryzisoli TaxID=1737571 RepID=A0ABZ2C8S5_9BACI
MQGMTDMKGVRFLMDSWIMAALLAVTPVTTSLGAMATRVEDKNNHIYKDFIASPLKRSTLASSYIISGFFISLILTFITFILAELYIVIFGGELLSIEAMFMVILLIIFTTAASSLMMFYLVSWFKSINTYTTASTIVGTLIGFLTGIYIPIGSVPEAVQMVIKLFPTSHAGVLFRSVMMKQAEKVTFADAPASVLEDFRLNLGVSFKVGDTILPIYSSILYILIFMVLFFVLSLFQISIKEK